MIILKNREDYLSDTSQNVHHSLMADMLAVFGNVRSVRMLFNDIMSHIERR